ncbi:MAG TPA: hypothetical protein VIU15_37260 [Streptomyces sp.]
MELLQFGALVALVSLLILAVAAVLIVRITTKGTDSRHRADVLKAVAGVVRAVRGRP